MPQGLCVDIQCAQPPSSATPLRSPREGVQRKIVHVAVGCVILVFTTTISFLQLNQRVGRLQILLVEPSIVKMAIVKSNKQEVSIYYNQRRVELVCSSQDNQWKMNSAFAIEEAPEWEVVSIAFSTRSRVSRLLTVSTGHKPHEERVLGRIGATNGYFVKIFQAFSGEQQFHIQRRFLCPMFQEE